MTSPTTEKKKQGNAQYTYIAIYGRNPSPLSDHVHCFKYFKKMMDMSTQALQALGRKCSHPKSWSKKKTMVFAISPGILTQLAVPQSKPPGVNCACLKKPRTNAVAAFQRYKTEASRDETTTKGDLFVWIDSMVFILSPGPVMWRDFCWLINWQTLTIFVHEMFLLRPKGMKKTPPFQPLKWCRRLRWWTLKMTLPNWRSILQRNKNR